MTYLSKCFFPTLYVNRGWSNAFITLSHLLTSLTESSSGSSVNSNPDMPKLTLLSSRVNDCTGLSPSRVCACCSSCSGSSKRLFCLLKLRGPVRIFPPLMLPSRFLRMSFSSGLFPSTMTPPLRFFQLLATSSSTFSARPSSLHPEPQCLPIKVASSCRAVEVSVRLCFLVNVRKASGRSVAGGRMIGRIAAFVRTGG